MADVMALKAGSWVTAKAIEGLIGYLEDAAGAGMIEWAQKLRGATMSQELRAVQGVHDDVREGMAALSESIDELNRGTREGTKAVLRALVELRESQRHEEQHTYLRKAVDAMDDLTSGMYAKGNPKNIALLGKASSNAQEAARSTNGDLSTKLQAYKLWVVTEYMHEVTTANGECHQAKKTAIIILVRVILSDPEIVRVCQESSSPQSLKEPAPQEITPGIPEETRTLSRSERHPVRAGVTEVMEFLFDITSSVGMLPPLGREVSYRNHLTAGVGGSLTQAPHDVMFAMGQFCADNPEVAQTYPDVTRLALEAWDGGKEKLALDNFFISMGGGDWLVNRGWTEGDAALGDRFGVTTDDGHVTKISLAANNLQGFLNDDLANCEHLRELVLHGNYIMGDVPARLQSLINSKPGMVITGLPGPLPDGPGMPGPATPHSPYSRDLMRLSVSSSISDVSRLSTAGHSGHSQGLPSDQGLPDTNGAHSSEWTQDDSVKSRKKESKHSFKGVVKSLKSMVGSDFAAGYK